MDLGEKNGMMGLTMKGYLLKGKKMEKEFTSGQMEAFIRVVGI